MGLALPIPSTHSHLPRVSGKQSNGLEGMAIKKIGQVASLKILLMAIALEGIPLYAKSVGQAARAPRSDQNMAELAWHTTRPTRGSGGRRASR